MIKPRFLARFLAWAGGYFWLPCPICKEPFAGFEWRAGGAIWKGDSGQGVCDKPQCQIEAVRRSDRRIICMTTSAPGPQ